MFLFIFLISTDARDDKLLVGMFRFEQHKQNNSSNTEIHGKNLLVQTRKETK